MVNKALITGCCGYFGSQLMLRMAGEGWDIVGVDSDEKAIERIIGSDPDINEVVIHAKSLLQYYPPPDDDMVTMFDAVIHLAGIAAIGDSEDYNFNVSLSKHLRNIFPKTPIYFASTAQMYDETGEVNPKHPYSKSKLEAEQYANVSFRMGSLVGANYLGQFSTVVDLMIDSAYKDKMIYVAYGYEQKPLLEIEHACELWLSKICYDLGRQWQIPRGEVDTLVDHCVTIDKIARTVYTHLKPKLNDLQIIEYEHIETSPIKAKLTQYRQSPNPPVLDGTDWGLNLMIEKAIDKYEATRELS